LRERVRTRVVPSAVASDGSASVDAVEHAIPHGGGRDNISEIPGLLGRRRPEHVRSVVRRASVAGLPRETIRRLRRIVIVGCGSASAHHAALLGSYAFREWAQIPCDAVSAEDWHASMPLVRNDELVIGISLRDADEAPAVLREARARGASTIGITDCLGGAIDNAAEHVVHTGLGETDGFARAISAQSCAVYELALKFAEARGVAPDSRLLDLGSEVHGHASRLEELLAHDQGVSEIARRHEDSSVLFLGRDAALPICLEAALRLGNVSNIATAALAPGVATRHLYRLVDETTLVVLVAIAGRRQDHALADVELLRASGSQVMAIVPDDDEAIEHLVDAVAYLPHVHPLLQALLAAAPLQGFVSDVEQRRRLGGPTLRRTARRPTSQAVDAERGQLARELHDGPTQELALITRMANAVASQSGDARVIRIATAAERGLDQCRDIIGGLRAESGAALDVELARLLIALEPDLGPKIEFELESGVTLDRPGRVAALAIAREAILNAASHSRAATIRVRLSNDPGGVSLSVCDDGVGFAVSHAPPGTFGVIGMRERARLVGADLRIDSVPGAGTTIEARFK
jgi:signal transduction histidine kinase